MDLWQSMLWVCWVFNKSFLGAITSENVLLIE